MAKTRKLLIAVMPVPDGFAQYGSLPPLIKSGEIAQKRGYEVTWTCCSCLKDTISRNFPKNEVITYPDSTLFGLPIIFQQLFVKMLTIDWPQWMMPGIKTAHNSEWLFESYLTIGLNKQTFLDKSVLTVINTIQKKQIDIVMSFADPVGMIAAHITGTPVMNFDNFMPVKESGGKGARTFNAAVSATIRKFSPCAGKVVKFSEIYRNDRQFKLLSSIERIGEKPKHKNAAYVADFQINKKSIRNDICRVTETELQNQRVVFAYFGAVSVSFGLSSKVISHAFELVNQNGIGKPWHCYFASQFVKKPYSKGNVHFAPYYDGEFLLTHAELTFSHGGLMTLYDSLRHGVPLVLVPGSLYERRFNSQEVVSTGSGIMIEIDDFTPENVANYIQDDVNLKKMSESANKMAEKIRKSGNLEEAFEVMENGWLKQYGNKKLEVGQSAGPDGKRRKQN